MAEENPLNNEPTPEVVPNPLLLVDDSTKQFFEEYVGPGKKYPNVGELAKAYANADKHISELTRDSGKYKTEAESLKELLMENLVNPKPNGDEPNPNPTEAAPPAQPPVNNEAPPKENQEVDLKALVKEALAEVSTEDKRRNNAISTEEATVKRFGSKEDAVKAIQAKATELGVSPDWIANLAFESPKAYFATMGFEPDETPRSNNTPASGSEVNTTVLKNVPEGQAARPGTYRYYQNLRKTDPAKYRSRDVQAEIMRFAAENPDFYK